MRNKVVAGYDFVHEGGVWSTPELCEVRVVFEANFLHKTLPCSHLREALVTPTKHRLNQPLYRVMKSFLLNSEKITG